MVTVQRDDKIYGQIGDKEALIASDKVDMIVRRDNYGNTVDFEAVFHNKVYTGFGYNDLPPMAVSVRDIPEDKRNMLIGLITEVWMTKIIDFLNVATNQNPQE